MTVERKVFPLEEAALDGAGILTGYGAHFDNEDDGGDTIVKGFFEPVIADFLKEGFISWGHDWSEPIAMPREATEDDKGLLISAAFHSTPRAQEARTIASERLAEGKSIGLSIGYEVDGEKGVEELPKGRRILKRAKRLFEIGLVMVPMNRLATATSVKAALGAGLPYAERLELVADEVTALAEHSRDRAFWREKEGRTLSSSNRERLSRILGLRDVLDDIETLLAETDPERDKTLAWAMSARARMALARVEYEFE